MFTKVEENSAEENGTHGKKIDLPVGNVNGILIYYSSSGITIKNRFYSGGR